MTNQKLHHCMVVYAPYPYYETRVQREAEALVKRGHSVDVICPKYKDDQAFAQYQEVDIYRVNMVWDRKESIFGKFVQYIQFFVRVFWKTTHLHIKHKYNTIQTHNIPDFLVFSTIIPKLMGAGIILDLHDLMPEFFQSRVGLGSKKFLMKMILLQERISCRFADLVITVTEHWKQNLIDRGIPPKKVIVVMNLADQNIFQSLPFSPLRNPNRFCLFYHGGMPHRYGLDLVLKAIKKLQDQIPTINFKLVGNGESREELKQLSQELQLNDHVEFIKSQPAANLQSLIATADVAVVPYLNDVFTDSLMPTKLMEYAVCGIPCIVSRTTAISAYFDNNMVEFFKPGNVDVLADAILRLYKNPQRRRELAINIQRFNEIYNWEKQSAAYVSSVENLSLGRS
jgi:glycosyltransferase involved in cell wall biosynthesis